VRLVPAFGWQSVFVVGGVVPLLLLPLLVFRLPESARFLALNGEEERLARVLARVGLDAPPEEEEAESDGGRSRVGRLFSGGRAVGTLSLWATLFLSLLLTYLLASWIPLLARQAGLGPASATLGVVALNLGAIIGCVVIGRIADRTRPAVVVGIAFALGAVAIAAIGRSQHSGAVLLVASLLAGGLSIGAQMCTVGLCAGFYDTSVRATGVGWAVGVGRVGGIVGPVLGGVLIAAGISTPNLFLVAAVASLGAAAAVFGLARRRKAGDEIVALADKTTHREGPATVSSGLDLPTDPGAGGSGSVNRG
jgi:AAHS family 4-hydroxybenzoate transporter-like MFS transporter